MPEHCLACGREHTTDDRCAYVPPSWLTDARVVQDYDVTRRIGGGGMGETFLALHKQLRVKRVLKSSLPEKSSAEYLERFQKEARAASLVRHLNVATLHDYFICADGSPVAVWEYVDGASASTELQTRGAYPPRVAIELTLQILNGLSAIHRDMAHRDIKPGNLIIDRTNLSPVVKIIDFGLAKLLDESVHSSQAVGTYPYMAYEAWDPSDVDYGAPTVDIFAVGAVLYEFLVGARAYSGNAMQVASQIAAGREPEWRGPLSPGLPLARGVIPILKRALARRAADRYQTAEEFRDDLRYALAEFTGVGSHGSVRASRIEPAPASFTSDTVPMGAAPVAAPAAKPDERVLTTRIGDPTDVFLRAYLEELVDKMKRLDAVYVPLAATTKTRVELEPWHDPFVGAALAGGADEPASGPQKVVHLDDLVDALNVHRQFYIVGEPGAGKTLSLIAMELAAARRYLAGTYNRFPLRIDIAGWTDGGVDFDALVEEELERRTRVKTLPPARLLLLIDGAIDSAAAPRNPLNDIEAWLRRYRGCAAALCVRSQRSLTRELPSVRIDTLDDQRIRTIVNRFLGEERAAVLLHELGLDGEPGSRDRDISALARNPFNLSLICGLQSSDKLPETQAALMRQVLTTRHARESRGPGRPSWEQFVEALGAVAIRLIRGRTNLVVEKAALRKFIGTGSDLDEVLALAIDCDVMRQLEDSDRYEVKHRLYLEYFAAEYLARHHSELGGVLHEPRYELGERVARRFDEVVQTLVQLDSDIEIVKTITEHDPLLAATCMSSLAGDEDERSAAEATIVNGLTQLMSDSNARDQAIAVLANIGPRAIAALRRVMSDQRPFVRRGAVRALVQIPHELAVDAVLNALTDSNRWVREDARAAIRRFDLTSRDLFLRCLRRSVEQSAAIARPEFVNALATLIDAVDAGFASAIAAAAGIDLTREEVAVETSATEAAQFEAVDADEEDAGAAREEVATSWGYRWIAERQGSANKPDLAASGRAWLRATSLHDPAWAYVWTDLWEESVGDPDLEWLGRDWLQRVPKTAKSWSHVWRAIFRHNRHDAAVIDQGWRWMREVPPHQVGWNHVWLALWDAKNKLEDLSDLAWWWLDVADANHESWSIIWTALWDASKNREALDTTGRRWLLEADSGNASWGFVWPRLWSSAPGDEVLDSIGRQWVRTVDPDHPAWGHIWPPLWEIHRGDADLKQIAGGWLRLTNPNHNGWAHVWDPLWQANKGAPELDQCAREWLAATSAMHSGWSRVWTAVWNRSWGDAQLEALGREWLTNARAHFGWVYIISALLQQFPGDASLLAEGRAGLERVPEQSWPTLWMRLWDHGGDRPGLADVGRSWLREHRTSGGFSFIWERLWDWSPADPELYATGIAWLRTHMDDRKWQFVAHPIADADPHDRELLAVVGEYIDSHAKGALNWAAASRIMSNARQPIARDAVWQQSRYATKGMTVRREVRRYIDHNEIPEAEAYLRRMLDSAERSKDVLVKALALVELGGVLRKSGQFGQAQAALLTALDMFTNTVPQPSGRAAALHKLGDVCTDQSLWIEAEEAYRSAMMIRWSIGELATYAVTLDTLAMLHKDCGFYDAAREEALEAMELFIKYGTDRQRAACRELLRELQAATEKVDDPGPTQPQDQGSST